MRKHIFNAGPSIHPIEVLEKASKAVLELSNSGMSILEVSHRGTQFTEIITTARNNVKELLGLNDDYEVLFLQGGASTQFCMLPYNFLDKNSTAIYTDTGNWANKAIKEARFFGNVNVIASSRDSNYTSIPKGFEIPEDTAYVHLTSNNTIYGTQYHDFPETNVPLVIDMSSDIFSRKLDYSKFDLIYAGAQKNIGPAGTTLVIIKKSLLDRQKENVPSMLNYKVHVDKESVYNTPPVFAVYCCGLTLKWIKNNGGLDAMHNLNELKAQKLYSEIDRNSLFKGTANKEDRSWMNVTFLANSEAQEKAFLSYTDIHDITGIKGYRTVGGFRASLYNALPEESVDLLITVMQEFERRHL